MCNQCNDSKREHGAAVHDRREDLMAGAALVTVPLLAGVATGAPAAQTGVPVGNGPFSARAYGASSASSPLRPLQIERRARAQPAAADSADREDDNDRMAKINRTPGTRACAI